MMTPLLTTLLLTMTIFLLITPLQIPPILTRMIVLAHLIITTIIILLMIPPMPQMMVTLIFLTTMMTTTMIMLPLFPTTKKTTMMKRMRQHTHIYIALLTISQYASHLQRISHYYNGHSLGNIFDDLLNSIQTQIVSAHKEHCSFPYFSEAKIENKCTLSNLYIPILKEHHKFIYDFDEKRRTHE